MHLTKPRLNNLFYSWLTRKNYLQINVLLDLKLMKQKKQPKFYIRKLLQEIQ